MLTSARQYWISSSSISSRNSHLVANCYPAASGTATCRASWWNVSMFSLRMGSSTK